MGVKGLWRLLLPIGHRISIETLEGQTLAIDASIWLTQFLKAARDPDTGAVRPAAHLLGFLRRICRLLYHGIRPVFVFDGATPAIKLREIRARRERRERMTIGLGGGGGGSGGGDGGDADGAIKRMARKLLVAELKRQKELKASGNSNKGGNNGNSNKEKGGTAGSTGAAGGGGGGAFSSNFNLDGDDDEGEGNDDEGDNESGTRNSQHVQGHGPSKGEEVETKKQSAAAAAADGNGATNAEADGGGIIDLSELDDGAEYLRRGHGQEEDRDQNDWDNPKPPALFGSDDDDDSSSASGGGEVQIPEDEDQLSMDAVLSLPPNQRKDVIEKAKRQQRLRSRKEFMPAAADPEAYSQVQLRNFLRSSNLNKKINAMGKRAARGEGVEGVEGEAIASDATRRIIFTKDNGKDKDNGSGGGGRKAAHAGHSAGAAMASSAVSSQLDDTPSRRRHRLRRLGKQHAHDIDSDDDDDDIFGNESNHKTAHGVDAASGKARPFYSSSEDDNDDDEEAGGGGFLVEDDISKAISNTKQGGSPDPKRSNYKSHTHHNESGWTLDEANVFGPMAGDQDRETSDDDGGGGGFFTEDTPNLSISGGETKSSGTPQVMEDEMLARALQEAENEDAVVPKSTVEEVILVGTTARAKKRARKNGGVSSRSQEEADAMLAAQLEAEERNQVGHRSEIIVMSGPADKRSKVQGTRNGGVVLLDSDSDVGTGDDDSDVEVLPPPGKRKRGGVRAKKPPVLVKSPPKDELHEVERNANNDENDDDIAWEDGNTGDDDVDWEDGDEDVVDPEPEPEQEPQLKGNGLSKVPAVYQSASDEEEDIAWEDGGGDEETNDATNERTNEPMEMDDAMAGANNAEKANDNSRRTSSRRSSLSEADGDFDGDAPNDFTLSPSNNANLAALKHAEETAANLTNWAGRAVRRAIAAHMEESGAPESPQASTRSPASVPTKDPTTSTAEEVVLDGSSDVSSDEELDDAITEAVRKETAITSEGNKPLEMSTMTDPSTSQSSASNRGESPIRTTAATSEMPSTTAAAPAASIAPSMDTSLEALRMEHSQMQDEMNRQQRDNDTITDEMKEEIIQLLQCFGIPYVEAPAEAEAQACALEALGLVDGVVTEDSDAFVFGGKKVYKNIFDDQKYVEAYVAGDAERDLGLGHNHMIALAMLLGGDYTDGVKGVGIVNGMEVLQAFDVSVDIKSGLAKFRQWLDGFELADVATRTQAEKEFHNKHRSARNRWIAPKDFPSPSVLTAYKKPVVDKSDARFSWGLPDIEALRTFAAQKMGWPVEETDRVILPVIKALESAGARQTRLESYFMRYEDDIKFANVKSKRLQSVLRKVKGDGKGKDGNSDAADATNDEGK